MVIMVHPRTEKHKLKFKNIIINVFTLPFQKFGVSKIIIIMNELIN